MRYSSLEKIKKLIFYGGKLTDFSFSTSRKGKYRFTVSFSSGDYKHIYFKEITTPQIEMILAFNWKSSSFVDWLFDNNYIDQEQMLIYKLS